MRLEGRSRQLRAQLRKAGRSPSVARGVSERSRSECTICYILPLRLVPRLRETSPQPPSFRQRIATAQERDECLCGLLPISLAIFATMRGC